MEKNVQKKTTKVRKWKKLNRKKKELLIFNKYYK